MTQTGKVIHRESKSIEISKSSASKGQALIPPSRLEQGVRFIGAMSVKDSDSIMMLDATGNIVIHKVEDLLGAGAVKAGGLILSLGLIRSNGERKTAS
jgi:hypothetical protein